MKKLLSILLCLVLVFALSPLMTAPAKAYTSGEWEFTISGGETTVQRYANKNHYSQVTVPETLGGCPVTAIGSFTFYGNTDLCSVTIPESVTEIGISAFANCSRLSYIKAPGILTIGQRAFSGCTALNGWNFPDQLTEIGWEAFSGCSRLEDITIPESVASIGGNAFAGCTGLLWVHYEDSYDRYSEIVNKQGNEPLITARTLYSKGQIAATGSCGEEGGNVRWTMTELEGNEYEMLIEGEGRMGNYTGYADRPWSGFLGHVVCIKIGAGVTSIGANSFNPFGYDLKEVQMSGSAVTEIGENAFLGCSLLSEIRLPSSLTTIGPGAFQGCSGLKSITIPAGLTAVGEDAFANCTGLERVDITDLAAWCAIDFDEVSNPLCFRARLYLNGTEVKDLVIPSGIKEIKPFAFVGCSSLKNLTIPVGVTDIGGLAFCDCVHLQTVTIPATVTFIDHDAFDNCSKIQDVYYGGTESDWEKIVIADYNSDLTKANIHYSSPMPLTVAGITADRPSVYTGEKITWTAEVTGGTAPLKYCFYVYQDGAVVHSTGYGTASTVSYTPTAAGSYKAKVFVKDSAGKSTSRVSGSVTALTAPAAVAPTVTGIAADRISAVVGEKITWTATATGGTAPLRYCFYVYQDGTVVQSTGYGTASTVSYTPTAVGTYKVKVFVKDNAGRAASRLGGSIPVTAIAPVAPTVTGITADKSSAAVGEKITWTATVIGGIAPLRYCFYVYQDGTVVYSTGYGAAASASYTPTAAGTYKAKVFVKDNVGKSASRVSGNIPVTAGAAVAPTVTGITADKTSAAVGEKITWTATVTGGTAPLRYCFYVYQDGTVVQNTGYGTASTVSYTPTAAGTYKVKVFVKDSVGKTASRLSGNIPVTAAASAPTVVGITADKTSAAVGEKITWTATVTGGTAPLQYCFYIYQNGTVVHKTGYSASLSTTYTPTAAGAYTVKVFVKDNAGKSTSKAGGNVTVS